MESSQDSRDSSQDCEDCNTKGAFSHVLFPFNVKNIRYQYQGEHLFVQIVFTNIVKDGDKKLHHCTQFICMSLRMQHVNILFLGILSSCAFLALIARKTVHFEVVFLCQDKYVKIR